MGDVNPKRYRTLKKSSFSVGPLVRQIRELLVISSQRLLKTIGIMGFPPGQQRVWWEARLRYRRRRTQQTAGIIVGSLRKLDFLGGARLLLEPCKGVLEIHVVAVMEE